MSKPPPVKKLLTWYKNNSRPFPWRETSDPYPIWISEIMLQQTVSRAVVPFFKKFIKTFPSIQKLAHASIDEVYENWAGLGYYSRARNIHKAAQVFAKSGFPNTYQELIKQPGLGPYTARAVASFAFKQEVGVLDGNVIRFLSRYYNSPVEWWRVAGRKSLQDLSDEWATTAKTPDINQALIEIGASICLPKNPQCLLCPVKSNCQAQLADTTLGLPLKPAKKAKEPWSVTFNMVTGKRGIAFTPNNNAPFLKKALLPPIEAKKLNAKPKKFDFKHNITHHEIYVTVKIIKLKDLDKALPLTWLTKKEVPKKAPFSLVQKTLARGLADK